MDFNKKIAFIFTLKSLIGMFLGLIASLIYYYKVGCTSGSCPITSNIWLTSIWGLVFGYLVGDMFNKKVSKSSEIKEEN